MQVQGVLWREDRDRCNLRKVPAVERVDGLEHREAPGKGRALLATRHFAAGDVVLTNRPIAVSGTQPVHVYSHCDNIITDKSQVGSGRSQVLVVECRALSLSNSC